LPGGILKVTEEIFHPTRPPSVAAFFFDLLKAAELLAHLTSGFALAQSAAPERGDPFGNMKLKFQTEISL
jgi:hypothetical protein